MVAEITNLINLGKLNEASDKLIPLYEQDKDNAEYAYLLGLIATKQDRYDEALKYLEQAEKTNSSDARIYEVFGEAYGLKAQNAGMVKGAMLMSKIKKSFEKALELNPDSLRARDGLFMFYLFVPGVAGGDENKALELAKEIAALNAAHGHLAQAVAHVKHNKKDLAKDEFARAAQQAPDDAEIQLKAGQFFLQNKDFDLAEKAIERLTRLKPFDPAGFDLLGSLYLAREQFAQAVESFAQALDKNPSFYPAKFNRAKAFIGLNQTDEARKDLQDILDRHAKSFFAKKAKELLASL